MCMIGVVIDALGELGTCQRAILRRRGLGHPSRRESTTPSERVGQAGATRESPSAGLSGTEAQAVVISIVIAGQESAHLVLQRAIVYLDHSPSRARINIIRPELNVKR